MYEVLVYVFFKLAIFGTAGMQVAQLSSLEKGKGTEEPSYSANYEPASQATTADELEGSTSANNASDSSVVCTQHSEAPIKSSLSNGIQKTDEDDFFSQLPEEPVDFFRLVLD